FRAAFVSRPIGRAAARGIVPRGQPGTPPPSSSSIGGVGGTNGQPSKSSSSSGGGSNGQPSNPPSSSSGGPVNPGNGDNVSYCTTFKFKKLTNEWHFQGTCASSSNNTNRHPRPNRPATFHNSRCNPPPR
uniref:Uncharacterized protein n=1 Tax=Panagrolaimus sp. ES5 TaxID=591445 RepID=A0AC34GMT0_9BILA